MKRTLLPLILVLLLLFGCSGEGYVSVANLTPSPLYVSVNDEADVAAVESVSDPEQEEREKGGSAEQNLQ